MLATRIEKESSTIFDLNVKGGLEKRKAIREFFDELAEPMEEYKVLRILMDKNLAKSTEDAFDLLHNYMRRGDVYEPKKGWIQRV